MAEQQYMVKPLEVFAIDGQMNRATGSIPYTSLTWHRRYHECGEFSMTVPASIYDPSWYFIETDERPETGIVQKVQYTDDPTYGNDDTVTISGFFLESIMNRRTFLDETPEEVTYRYYVSPPSPPKKSLVKPDVYKDADGRYWYSTPSGSTYGVYEGTPSDSPNRIPGGGVQTSFLFPYSGSEKSSIMLRHGERANVLWADGHASSEGARDLAENKGKQNRYLVAGSGAWLPIL